MIETYHCPTCSALLERSGVVAINGEDFPVFQCDTCTKPAVIFGETFEVAITFLVDKAGRPFNPADPSLPSEPGL